MNMMNDDDLAVLEMMDSMFDPDDEYAEDPELLESFDPSVFEDAAEMADDFDVFYSQARLDNDGDVTLLSDEDVSLDLTDQIDWDSIDYE